MSGIYKKCLVLVACCLAIGQLQAQVSPGAPVTPGNTQRLSPRPIRPIVAQPNRPGQQVMPQQRDYTWYLNHLQKRGKMNATTNMARKPMAIANPAQMPANRSFDWYRQHLAKRFPHLQQPTAARSTVAGNAVMPAQRSYEWYQQHLNASRQRAHLTPMPGYRD
jgi:hypothetical protein